MRNLPTVTTLGGPTGLQGGFALGRFRPDLGTGNRVEGSMEPMSRSMSLRDDVPMFLLEASTTDVWGVRGRSDIERTRASEGTSEALQSRGLGPTCPCM